MSESSPSLATRCAAYLHAGPPEHMTDYIPESLTEIIIDHGARSMPLDAELREVAGLILLENDFSGIPDTAIRAYMDLGASLVREVLEHQE